MTPALAALVSQAIAVYGDGHDHPSFRVATLVTTHGVRHGFNDPAHLVALR